MNWEVVKHLGNNTSLVRSPELQAAVRRRIPIHNFASSLHKSDLPDHPNIVKTLWQEKSGTDEYTVFEEYCRDGSIVAYFGNKQLSTSNVMLEIAQGVKYIHQKKKFVHNCIRSSNIFIREGTAVVGGIWKQPDEQSYYDAPETIDGRYGYAANIWELGVVFLEVVLGMQIPTALGTDLFGTLNGPYLERLLTSITNNPFKDIIERMLSPQASQRPSIEEVVAALNFSVVQPDTPATPASILQSLYKDLRDFWFLRCSNKRLAKNLKLHHNLIEQQAANNNPRAMFLLGRAFDISTKVEDHPKAKYWLQRAVEAGESLAYLNLYYFGVEKEKHLDLDLLRKGYRQGDYRSGWKLGRQLGYGFDNLPIHEKQALDIMKSLRKDYPLPKYDIVWLTAKVEGYYEDFPQQLQHILVEGAQLALRRAVQALSDCLSNQGKHVQAIQHGMICMRMQDDDCIGEVHQVLNRVGVYLKRQGDWLLATSWLKLAVRRKSRAAFTNMMRGYIF